jgi:hypothetical protein
MLNEYYFDDILKFLAFTLKGRPTKMELTCGDTKYFEVLVFSVQTGEQVWNIQHMRYLQVLMAQGFATIDEIKLTEQTMLINITDAGLE